MDGSDDYTSKGVLNKPSGVQKFMKDREALIRDRKPEFTSPTDRTGREPLSQDMFESLTQAVKMIKRWG